MIGAMALRSRAVGPLLALPLLLAGAAAARAEADWLERDRLTGSWQGVRPILDEHGFELYLTYTGMMWSVPAGGDESGTEFSGYLDFGFDLDLEKLGAPHGSGFHADFHWYQGRDPTSVLLGGTFAMAVDEWEASNALRVFNLYFRQDFGDDRYQIQAGQIAADSSFMAARYAGLFVNAAYGDLPNENVNTNTPVYPLAAPGVYLEGKPDDSFTFRSALYTGNAGQDLSGNHGFGWKLGNNAGYALYTELTLHTQPGGLEGNTTLGGYYVAGNFPVIGTDETRYGNYDVYVMLDHALALDERGKPKVGAFARFSVSPQQDRNLGFLYGDAGLNVFAPIDSRPDDVAGLAVGILRASGHDQLSSSSPVSLPSGQAVLELTYQAAVTPWLTLQPDLQLILDPVFSQSDALVIGVQAVALF